MMRLQVSRADLIELRRRLKAAAQAVGDLAESTPVGKAGTWTAPRTVEALLRVMEHVGKVLQERQGMAGMEQLTRQDLEAWRRVMGWTLRFLIIMRPLVEDRPALHDQAENLEELLSAMLSALDQILA